MHRLPSLFMIPRKITSELLLQLNEYPIVMVLGPRQAGKTTLVKAALPDYGYVSLENPETRQIATENPRAFLKQHAGRVIFDEIQRTPHLLSYLQEIVDWNKGNGQFVLTGSHQLELRTAIAQSLAGRTGMLHLLPLSIAELDAAGIHFDSFEEYIFQGFMPRIYDQQQRPHTAYANYYQTYVERDVSQLIHLKDASLFEKFIRLLAGRIGQIINYQSLANDVGMDSKTVKQWLSILEASFIDFKLAPYFENFGTSDRSSIQIRKPLNRRRNQGSGNLESEFQERPDAFLRKIQPLAQSYAVYSSEVMFFSGGVEVVPYNKGDEIF